jgi:hypothetical protein
MGSRVLPLFVLLSLFVVWTTATVGAVSVGLNATGTVQASQAPGFGAKLQAGGSLGAVLLVPLGSRVSLTTSLDAFGVLPSDASGGFVYKGCAGLALGAGLEVLFPIAASERLGTLSLGVAAGAAGALPTYLHTTLYFFYPEVRSAIVLSWQPAAPAFMFRVEMPVRFQFRRDMTLSAAAGLTLDVFYYLGGSR